MQRGTMPTPLTRSSRPNKGGSISMGGVTRRYAPSPAAESSLQRQPGMNSGGTISANVAPGVRMTRSFAPSSSAGRSSVGPGGNPPQVLQPSASAIAADQAANRPNLGGVISAQLAPGVSMTRRIAPSVSIQPGHNPNMNAGGTIQSPISAGVHMTRSFAPTPTTPPPALQPVNGQLAAPQQTEQANPLTGDGGGPMDGQSEVIGDVPGLFSARGSGAPRGADAIPGQITGGSGLYSRKFTDPRKAAGYTNFTRGLFA